MIPVKPTASRCITAFQCSFLNFVNKLGDKKLKDIEESKKESQERISDVTAAQKQVSDGQQLNSSVM